MLFWLEVVFCRFFFLILHRVVGANDCLSKNNRYERLSLSSKKIDFFSWTKKRIQQQQRTREDHIVVKKKKNISRRHEKKNWKLRHSIHVYGFIFNLSKGQAFYARGTVLCLKNFFLQCKKMFFFFSFFFKTATTKEQQQQKNKK